MNATTNETSGTALSCDFCATDAEWTTGGGAVGVTNVCDLHRAICDAEPDNEGTEWDAVRAICACGEVRDDFGACWKCDGVEDCDAAYSVALCARCSDESACDDHEVRP